MTPTTHHRARTTAVLACLAALMALAALLAPAAATAQTPPITELPQLQVTNISFSNDKPMEGVSITITVVIHNNGTGDVHGVGLTIAYDRVNITKLHNLTVPAQGNETVNITWKSVKFTHVMSALPDVDGVPFAKAAMTKTLVVEAEPIGNAYLVFGALMLVLLVFLAAVAAPSVWDHIVRRDTR